MKKTKAILIFLVFLSIGIFIVKDAIVKISIQSAVSFATGLRLDIKSLNANIFKTFISIKDMVVLNPSDFSDKIMLNIPEIYIDYDLGAILTKRIHLYDVRIDVKEMTIVKDRDGRSNLDYVKSMKKGGKKEKRPSKSKGRDLKIDNLLLKIGKVTYKDYSGGGDPVVLEYNINIESRYRNIKNVDEIMKMIIAKALIDTAIGKISEFTWFKDAASDTLEEGKNMLKTTVDEFKNIFKNSPINLGK